jgi:hypothetical protein
MIKEPIIHSKNASFETVLDETCERLLEKKIHHSVVCLAQMEADLTEIEKELSSFLQVWKYEKQ